MDKKTENQKMMELLKGDNPIKALQDLVLKRSIANPLTQEMEKWVLLVLKEEEQPELTIWARKVAEKYQFYPQEEFSRLRKPGTMGDDSLKDLIIDKVSLGMGDLQSILCKQEKKTLPSLLAYLDYCQDPHQISFIVKNLWRNFKDPQLIEPLSRFLNHPDPRVISNAIEGMGGMYSPKTVELLSPFLTHPHHRVRSEAVKALRPAAKGKTEEVLLSMLHSEHSNEVLAALNTIKILNLKKLADQLENHLNNPIYILPALDALKILLETSFKEWLTQRIEKINHPDCREKLLRIL